MTRIGAALSTAPDAGEAARDAAGRLLQQLDGRSIDLAYAFLSPEHLPRVDEVVQSLRDTLAPRSLLGCVAQGVLAGELEQEQGPALALWAASLPGATIRTFHLDARVDEDELEISGLPETGEADLVTLLVDPYTFPADALLAALNTGPSPAPIVGGLAVGAGPHAQALLVDGQVHRDGAVGAVLQGVDVRTVVSQGCAPVGREAVVTDADENVILRLAGEPALDRLRHEFDAFTERERELASRGVLVGLVIDENKPDYGRGDFLMRGILGADEESGGLAVGEQVRVGQTVRFHVRDGTTAAEDLSLALDETLAAAPGAPAGALLFTCNGRGSHMFSEPDHDARAVSGTLATPGVAGFFCGGEIGPVGGRTFLHGFTATMAVFFDRDAPAR